MKVALVSPYDVSYPGGVADHIHHLARELRGMSHTVKIIAPTEGGADDELVEHADFYGIGRAMKVPANGSTARITLQPFALGKPVRAVLRAEQFDVIHLHEPLMPHLPHVVLRHSTSINVGTFHAFSDSNLGYASFKPYLKLYYRALHARIAVSPAARAYVQSYFHGRIVTIPNGIETERFGPHALPFPQYRDGRPTILFVGRYNEPRKGFKYLLRALLLVRQQFPNVRLLVVGRGRPRRYLRYLEAHGLAENVEFVGYASEEDKPRFYRSADVFCSPATHGESFGMVVMEAMATGTPVVATWIPGHRGILKSGHEGLLVQPESAQALALALVRMLADSELREQSSVAGHDTASHYSWHEVSKRVVAQYELAERLQRRVMMVAR